MHTMDRLTSAGSFMCERPWILTGILTDGFYCPYRWENQDWMNLTTNWSRLGRWFRQGLPESSLTTVFTCMWWLKHPTWFLWGVKWSPFHFIDQNTGHRRLSNYSDFLPVKRLSPDSGLSGGSVTVTLVCHSIFFGKNTQMWQLDLRGLAEWWTGKMALSVTCSLRQPEDLSSVRKGTIYKARQT